LCIDPLSSTGSPWAQTAGQEIVWIQKEIVKNTIEDEAAGTVNGI
jgi:hypothetical protein